VRFARRQCAQAASNHLDMAAKEMLVTALSHEAPGPRG
jgi:hypothetical protein